MTLSARKRFLILKRDGFRCVYCGRGADQVELHVDHVEAKSTGGEDSTDNYAAACRDCNLGKGPINIFGPRQSIEDKYFAIYLEADGPLLIGKIAWTSAEHSMVGAVVSVGAESTQRAEIIFFDSLEDATENLKRKVETFEAAAAIKPEDPQ